MGVFGAKNYEPRLMIVWDITTLHAHMDLGKVPAGTSLLAEPAGDFLSKVVVGDSCGSVFRHAGYGGLRRIPRSFAIDVEVAGLVGQPPNGIAERRHYLARLHATELNVAFIEADVCRFLLGCRPEIDSSGDPPAG